MTQHATIPLHRPADTRTFTVWAALLLCLMASVFWPAARAQVTPQDLPPVDSVFKLEASAADHGRIRLRWSIRPGFYLYRHQFKFTTMAPGVVLGTPDIPGGDKHHDEFFGDVETYRGSVTAQIPVEAPANTTAVVLKVKYQGCADVGVCYPPQIRTVTVALPQAADTAGDAGFQALAGKFGKASAPSLTAPAGKAAPLPPEQAFKAESIADGGDRLLVRITPAPGYYLYKQQTRFNLKGDGIRLGTPVWPRAVPHTDAHFGKVPVYFKEIEVPVPLRRAHARATRIALAIEMQGCQDEGICYEPMQRTFNIDLPAAGVTTKAVAEETTIAPAPVPMDAATASAADAVVVNNAVPPAAVTSTEVQPAAAALPLKEAPLVSALSAWKALLFALLGGLILNLMPCVLPVLSMKAVSLAQSSDGARGIRRHVLAYAAGVVLSMLILGGIVLLARSLAPSGALAWGFQMQQPAVVGALALCVLAFGLSLSGWWYANFMVPAAAQRAATADGLKGDFATGILAVVLATPCTAPFMGAALGYAFFAPPLASAAVFVALGIGLALPFLLLGVVPAFARWIPKPGAWTNTFKRWMALPMYATVVWLAWLLYQLRGWPAVGWFLLAAAALTVLLGAGRKQNQAETRTRWLRGLAVAVIGIALFMLHAHTRAPAPASANAMIELPNGLKAERYSAERLQALRQSGTVVFVDVTADWCITCKVNERAVLFTPALKSLFETRKAVYMIADNTQPDPAIAAFLRTHNAVGLPLYVVYPANGGPGHVLPTVLTHTLVEGALQAAANGPAAP